jgi:hypothetical protein
MSNLGYLLLKCSLDNASGRFEHRGLSRFLGVGGGAPTFFRRRRRRRRQLLTGGGGGGAARQLHFICCFLIA